MNIASPAAQRRRGWKEAPRQEGEGDPSGSGFLVALVKVTCVVVGQTRGCVALEFFTSTLFTLDLKKRLRAKKRPQRCE